MSTFDQNEQNIYDALSQITVDANQLAGQVKRRLHEEISGAASPPLRARRTISVAAAAAILAVLAVTATAAALGGFDWFIEKFHPPFSAIVEPVEVSCEDQGIRMEVIGAQKYENKAIVYLSLRDISGQNRLTEQTDFRDGFSVKQSQKIQEENGQGEDISVGSLALGTKMLYFDEETNTLYYEFNITSDLPLSDPLEVSSFLIYFEEDAYENEPVFLSLSAIGDAGTVSVREGKVWGGVGVPDDLRGITAALTPGHYAALPHGEDDQWISNIGILDGKLHVQTGNIFDKEFGSSDATLSLRAPDGQLIDCDYELMFFGDKDQHLLDSEEDFDDAVYKYAEAVFSVNSDELEGYTLCYSGSVYSGVEGNWRVAANLSDTSRKTRIWTNDIPVEGYLFEYMTLSPLGLQVIGSYTGKECRAGAMSLAVETADGIIPLEGGSGSENVQKQAFNYHWQTKVPLNVAAVTAVIINGTRIPVK
ncbi:MAG TPA: hypothetical protein VN441_09090 [Syntrophomonas sp.]|nr:hypothetical protein [Syntrophomonas sp.]